MPPTYYRGCWHVVSRGLFSGYRHDSSPVKKVYNPKTFFLHAALLGQACAHCPIFPTAASRRSLVRFSVPVWPIILSDRLPIVALVGRYLHQLANGTRGHLIPIQTLLPLYHAVLWSYAVLAEISLCCPPLEGRLLTCYSPVRHYSISRFPFPLVR